MTSIWLTNKQVVHALESFEKVTKWCEERMNFVVTVNLDNYPNGVLAGKVHINFREIASIHESTEEARKRLKAK